MASKKSRPQPRNTGRSFVDPKTGQRIPIIAKKGESENSAVARVRRKHGV